MLEVNLTEERLESISDKISDVKVCVVGDVCMDVYWQADLTKSRISRETPHFPLPVVRETFSPGAGGNVMQNVKALEPGELLCVSAASDDWRGMLLRSWFSKNGIDDGKIITRTRGITPAYCKPLRKGISDLVYEDPRIDFENFEPLCREDEDALLAALDEAAAGADILAVSDQFDFGVITPRVRERILELAKDMPVVADSRENALKYPGCIIKPNEVESARAVGVEPNEYLSLDDYCEITRKLQKQNGAPVIVTLGSAGSLWCDGNTLLHAPAADAKPPVDTVGAGDTFLSAFCCAYAACRDGGLACAYANLASGVTIKKIGTTGTATRAEIAEKRRESAYEL